VQGNPFENVHLVVYPAYVEHQPRLLLKAIAAGIPVVASTACGLMGSENVKIIPIGDYAALKQAVIFYLGQGMSATNDLLIEAT
jgi:glycosyltransferase involved in cell wall biosynthesis